MAKKTTLTATLPDGTKVTRTTANAYRWIRAAQSPFDGSWRVEGWTTQPKAGRATWAYRADRAFSDCILIPVDA